MKRTLQVKTIILLAAFFPLMGWAQKQGYAILEETTGTLTFSYGEKPEGSNVYDTDNTGEAPKWLGERISSGYSQALNIKRVIFEASFVNARPKSTRKWFSMCENLQAIEGIENLNTSSVTDMALMFHFCKTLPNIDVSHFNTENVTDLSNMFASCFELSSLDLSNINTSKVTNMYSMFSWCTKITSLDLHLLKTDNVSNMAMMFNGCKKLENIDISGFNTGNVTDMSYMFDGCEKLSSLDVSHFDTKKVENMSFMFSGCYSIKKLDVSHFVTNNVQNMSYMFYACGVTSLDLSNFDTSNVINMTAMFRSSEVTSINVSNFNTSNVTNMSSMFSGCTINSLDLSNFNTTNVTDMSEMFGGCKGLININLSTFNTGNVTNMSKMFFQCSNLTSLNLSNFDTHNVTDMSSMFSECYSLNALDISSFITSSVIDLSNMFGHCRNLNTIDLRNFDTSKATKMYLMFAGLNKNEYCNNEHIILGDKFNTTQNNGGQLFQNSTIIPTITFTGNLPNLSDNTFSGVGTISNPAELVVPSQYAENYSSKMDATGKFYGGYFKLAGNTVDTSMPEPNVGTKRLTAITRKKGNNDLERSEMTYDDKGRIVNFVYANGTKTETVSYTYVNDIIYIEHYTQSGTNKHEYHFANGKVSYAPITLESENLTGNRVFEYDSSNQLTKMSIAFDGSSVQNYAKIDWADGSPVSYSYNRVNISDGTETELHNSLFTLNNMQSEPVVHAIFGMGEGKNVNIDDDIMELMAFYPFVGKQPERLIDKTIYTNSSGSQTEYNYTYESNSEGDIVKITIESKGTSTIYTLDWDGASNSGIEALNKDEQTSDAIYDISGKHLYSPQKGINIINGKKVIIRK